MPWLPSTGKRRLGYGSSLTQLTSQVTATSWGRKISLGLIKAVCFKADLSFKVMSINQSMGVMNISGVGGDLSLTYSGGQATVDLNSTATGVAFEGAPGPFPANTPAYKPIFSFTSISFELGWDFPGTGTSADGTGEIQITAEYLKKVLGGFAATPAKTVSYIVPPPPNGNRFLVQATDGDIITKVTVEAFSVSTGSPASFLDSVNQIRIGGDSDRLPPIVIQGDIVPEPTSLALAGFAGIGMAVGAIRRRRQQKSQAA